MYIISLKFFDTHIHTHTHICVTKNFKEIIYIYTIYFKISRIKTFFHVSFQSYSSTMVFQFHSNLKQAFDWHNSTFTRHPLVGNSRAWLNYTYRTLGMPAMHPIQNAHTRGTHELLRVAHMPRVHEIPKMLQRRDATVLFDIERAVSFWVACNDQHGIERYPCMVFYGVLVKVWL